MAQDKKKVAEKEEKVAKNQPEAVKDKPTSSKTQLGEKTTPKEETKTTPKEETTTAPKEETTTTPKEETTAPETKPVKEKSSKPTKTRPKKKPKLTKAEKQEKKPKKPKISRSKEAKELGKLRHKLKKKKPKFKRKNFGKVKRVQDAWRKPVGIDYKHQTKAKPRLPRAGYSTPKGVRGLNPTGYVEVQVRNLQDVLQIESNTQAAVVSSRIGTKKLREIYELCDKNSVIILNRKDLK